MATEKTSCNPGEYEVLGDLSCSRVCPAGYYVSRPIDQDHHIGACSQCKSGTFRAHPSEETRCTPCAQCREDQEVVKHCSTTSDRECQCQPGRFFCDSVDCTESCFRCTRCEDGAILQPCSPTSNTVCALNPQSGQPGSSRACLGVSVEACVILIFVLIAVVILIIVVAAMCWFFVYRGRTGRWSKPGGSVGTAQAFVQGSPGRHPSVGGQPQAFPPASTPGLCGGVWAPSSGSSQSNDLNMGPLAPSEDTSLDLGEESALLAPQGPGATELLQRANGSLAAPGEPGEQARVPEAPRIIRPDS